MPCRVYSLFYSDLTSDLVFDPTGPIFDWGLAFIKINILPKFHDDWIKTVPSGMYLWFC